MENCCICNASVAIGEEKKRRKRLYGPSCKTARDVLDGELSAIFDLQLKDFLNTEGTKCFVCKHCNSKLNSIQDLKNQVSLLRNEIKPYLEAFQPKAGESSTSLSITGEKRARSDTMVGIVSKRPCLEPNPSIPEPSASSSPAVSVSFVVGIISIRLLR